MAGLSPAGAAGGFAALGAAVVAAEEKKALSWGFPCDMSSTSERRDDRGASAILSLARQDDELVGEFLSEKQIGRASCRERVSQLV